METSRKSRAGDPTDAIAPETDEHRAMPSGPEIRLGALDDYIAYHLRLAQDASFRAFRRTTGRGDLRPGWFAVLSLIGDNPDISPAALSRATGRDKSSLTPVLRDLIRNGYLDRAPREGDRRSYGLRLTPDGRECLRELAVHAAAHDRALDEIAGPHKAELIAILRRIADRID